MRMADLALYGILAAAGIALLFLMSYGVLALVIVTLQLLGIHMPRRWRLWPFGINILKFFHILTACCWIGAAVSLIVISLITARSLNSPPAVAALGLIMADIDNWCIIPMAMANIASGIVLALCSGHTFRLAWVLAKAAGGVWALVVGWFFVTPKIRAITALTGQAAREGKFIDALTLFPPSFYVLGSLQFLLLMTMLALSVFKPWGAEGLVQKEESVLEDDPRRNAQKKEPEQAKRKKRRERGQQS